MKFELFLVLSFLIATSSQAHLLSEKLSPSDEVNLSKLIDRIKDLSFSERMEAASQAFIAEPYMNGGPLGEGPGAEFDQDPLYRTDGFDCTTFVETTTAVSESQTLTEFKTNIDRIRYKNAVVEYTHRNHFVEIDWIPNNSAAGFVKDVTLDQGGVDQRFVVPQIFNKDIWYHAKTLADLSLPGLSVPELGARLSELQHDGDQYSEQSNYLPMIDREALSDVIPQLPTPAIMNIVRYVATAPSVGLASTMVTHQVLLVKEKGNLRIRQASSASGVMRVIDQSVDDFIHSPLMTSSTTRGVNVLQVLEL